MRYHVYDKTTKQLADIEKIAREEGWANSLMYIDMEGFAIDQDGFLILMDECGKYVYCPTDRFYVLLETESE